MNNLLIGVAGSLLLIVGAAWPDKEEVRQPKESIKNWLFLVGTLIMFGYAILQYLNNGVIYFVLLEGLIFTATILMMLDFNDKWKASGIGFMGIFLAIYALYLFSEIYVLIFVLGLVLVGLGYVFKSNTLRRDAALTGGSILIVVYSFIKEEWVFFWLNLFFAVFAGYYLIAKILVKRNDKSVNKNID